MSLFESNEAAVVSTSDSDSNAKHAEAPFQSHAVNSDECEAVGSQREVGANALAVPACLPQINLETCSTEAASVTPTATAQSEKLAFVPIPQVEIIDDADTASVATTEEDIGFSAVVPKSEQAQSSADEASRTAIYERFMRARDKNDFYGAYEAALVYLRYYRDDGNGTGPQFKTYQGFREWLESAESNAMVQIDVHDLKNGSVPVTREIVAERVAKKLGFSEPEMEVYAQQTGLPDKYAPFFEAVDMDGALSNLIQRSDTNGTVNIGDLKPGAIQQAKDWLRDSRAQLSFAVPRKLDLVASNGLELVSLDACNLGANFAGGLLTVTGDIVQGSGLPMHLYFDRTVYDEIGELLRRTGQGLPLMNAYTDDDLNSAGRALAMFYAKSMGAAAPYVLGGEVAAGLNVSQAGVVALSEAVGAAANAGQIYDCARTIQAEELAKTELKAGKLTSDRLYTRLEEIKLGKNISPEVHKQIELRSHLAAGLAAVVGIAQGRAMGRVQTSAGVLPERTLEAMVTANAAEQSNSFIVGATTGKVLDTDPLRTSLGAGLTALTLGMRVAAKEQARSRVKVDAVDELLELTERSVPVQMQDSLKIQNAVKLNDGGQAVEIGGTHITIGVDGVTEHAKFGTVVETSGVDYDHERTKVTAQLDALVDSVVMAPEHRIRLKTDFCDFMERFEGRAVRDYLPEEEIGKTYRHLSRLLSTGNGKTVLSDQERALLAEQVLFQAAHPSFVAQGNSNTCAVAALENRIYSRTPSIATALVADVAITGKYVSYSGRIIDMEKISKGLLPDDEASSTNVWQLSEGPGREQSYGSRTFASQIFQETAVNTYWQHKLIRPDGKAVKPGDIAYTKLKPPQDTDTGERLYSLRTNRVFQDRQGRPISSPNLTADSLAVMNYHITGSTESPTFVVKAGRYMEFQGEPLALDSVDNLARYLSVARRNGDLPVVVAIPAAKVGRLTGYENDSGSGHVVTIRSFDHRDGTVELINQWSPKHDFVLERRMTVDELFELISP